MDVLCGLFRIILREREREVLGSKLETREERGKGIYMYKSVLCRNIIVISQQAPLQGVGYYYYALYAITRHDRDTVYFG